MRYIYLLVFLIISTTLSLGQSRGNITVSKNDNGKKLSQLLSEIETKYDYDFIVNNNAPLEAYTVTGLTEEISFFNFLELFVRPLGLIVIKKGRSVLFVPKAIYDSYGSRKDNFIILPANKDSKTGLVKGVVKESSNETIIGAQVVIPELQAGNVTDVNGNFSFRVKKGVYELKCRFVGYKTVSYIVAFSPLANIPEMEITMQPESIELEGIVVGASRSDNNVKSNITGVNTMSIKTIKAMPAFMGEVDVIKSLTTFPGVSTPGELSSGFNVRGGDSGQNLIMQDDAIIYNPTHLFGFFSAFNPDMVSNIELFKGGGSAKYGGRISSVLNVDLRNGDAGKFTVNGGLGLVSSRLTLEGPIKRDKSSFIVGGRISYVNWMIKDLENKDVKNSRANFYDLTAKFLFTLNKNNAISLSGYTSSDGFKLSGDSTFSWQTQNASFKWDHVFNETLSSKLSLSNSNYKNIVINEDNVDGFEYVNSINNSRLNYDVQFVHSDNYEASIGTDVILSEIEPGKLETNGINTEPVDLNDQHSLEAAFYVNNDFSLSPTFSLSAGLRFSNFWRLGADDVYAFDYTNLNGRYPSITDTVSYEKGEIIEYYNGWEPRLSLRYLIRTDFSIKGSYYLTYQYLHLISNTVSVTPQDYWVASSPHLKPERADQWSLGVFKNFKNDEYELSVEGFYKNIHNTIDYIEGADNVLNQSLEAGLIQGDGIAYGGEFMFRRNLGVISGWLSYTYSRSLRKFDSDLEYQTINDGKFYPSVYDQPHNLSLVLNLKMGDYVTFTTNFSYSTGRPITIPISKVSYEHYLSVLSYSQRNEYRIPDYHRLDISFTIKEKHIQNKKINGEWILGIYNLYGRKNTYSIFFSDKGSAFKTSILGTIFPYITYNFKI